MQNLERSQGLQTRGNGQGEKAIVGLGLASKSLSHDAVFRRLEALWLVQTGQGGT